MILFILLGILVAAIRGKHPQKLLHEQSLLPLAAIEIVFWVFQIFSWCGDYRFVPYGEWLQTASVLSLLWPILKFRLYPQALTGAAMVCAGSVLNRIAMAANGGRMPVYPTLSRLTGYYREGAIAASGDVRQVLMSGSTNLNFLGDFIDVGFSVMSVGDLLIHGFVALIVYGVAVRLCETKEGK